MENANLHQHLTKTQYFFLFELWTNLKIYPLNVQSTVAQSSVCMYILFNRKNMYHKNNIKTYFYMYIFLRKIILENHWLSDSLTFSLQFTPNFPRTYLLCKAGTFALPTALVKASIQRIANSNTDSLWRIKEPTNLDLS